MHLDRQRAQAAITQPREAMAPIGEHGHSFDHGQGRHEDVARADRVPKKIADGVVLLRLVGSSTV